jgi:plasmid stabilization system protein ParE
MRITLTRAAEQDLVDGFAFYARQGEGIGSYFLDSLFADIDALILYAGIHPKPDGVFHRALARRFPYAIYYRVSDTTVTVVAVLDCRRKPARIRKALRARA